VAHLLVIEGDGQWLSGGAYLCDGPLLEYHLGASSPQGKALGTACLMQAEAAAFGQARGARDLYLAGGTDTSPDNPLLFYKRGFSRRALTFRVGEAVHDDNRYQAAAARRGYSPQQPPPRLLFD
jgi:lipid II:glycine glycyltransferase (peptidoglycan interpeptide bridge formation enzyme)